MRDGEGLVVDVDTWHLRQGRVLVQSVPDMIVFLALGARAQRIHRFAFGGDSEAEPGSFIAHCHDAADAVDRNDLRKARSYGIPPSVFEVPDRNIRRLAIAEASARAGYDPDEPRAPAGGSDGGQWTSDSGGSNDPNIVPAAAKPKEEDVAVKKQRFVDAHLADAQKAADELGVPVENILGLSALESGWGEQSRFAREGNNFFGLHYPAPYAIGYLTAKDDPKVHVATFGSYADSLRSFVAVSGSDVRGVRDPTTFARILQDSGKFGLDEDGNKVPSYVEDVAGTIKNLRPYIDKRRA